jgi:hypothetical protein
LLFIGSFLLILCFFLHFCFWSFLLC